MPERPTPEELKEPSCNDSLALVGRYKHSCYILIRTQVRGLPGAGPTRVIVRFLPLLGFTAVPIRTVIPSLIVIIEIHRVERFIEDGILTRASETDVLTRRGVTLEFGRLYVPPTSLSSQLTTAG